MPSRPARICTYAGCGTLVRGGSRCERHEVKAWAHRGSRHERGYGSVWTKLRLQILERDQYLCRCAECNATGRISLASEVDHVINKARWLVLHGTLDGVDDPSNLAAINAECHKSKTQAEAAGKPSTPRGAESAKGRNDRRDQPLRPISTSPEPDF